MAVVDAGGEGGAKKGQQYRGVPALGNSFTIMPLRRLMTL
jgi:hypothetical protein